MLANLSLPGWRLATLRRTLVLMLIAPLLVAIIPVIQPVNRGFAQDPSTTIRLEPPSEAIDVSETITIEIKIEDVTELYGVDVRLSFDPALVEVQDADGNPANGVQIRGGSFPAPDFVVKNEADNDTGTIWYAVSQMNPTEPINGTGVAASITFQGLADGISPVEFSGQKIVKKNGDPIPATTEDGEIEVGAAGPTAITLSSLTASLVSGDLVSLGDSFAWPWLAGGIAALALGGALWMRQPSNKQCTPISDQDGNTGDQKTCQ